MNKKTDHKILLGLGTNLGNRELNLRNAQEEIEATGIKILDASGHFESSAWGYESRNSFLNMCIACQTSKEPEALLVKLKMIETAMGRTDSHGAYQDRIIDLDILFYDSIVLKTNDLIIPHPLLHERRFVLEPLMEIAPRKIHPLLKVTVEELLKTCTDDAPVKRLP